MNQKDLIKWGLLALGAYLIYRYIEEQGGISNLFGATTGTGTKCGTGFVLNAAGQCIAASTSTGTGSGAGTGTGTGAGAGSGSGSGSGGGTTTTATPPVLDMTGLTVVPDINNSLTGSVKINGVPTRLSIITDSGAIYDSTGTEVTAALQAQGIDIVALRTAFANAAPAPGVSGLGAAIRFTPSWLM